MSKDESVQLMNTDDNLELEESLRKLASASEKEFETIKHEKWYTRLWDKVTFSNKGELRLCEQIKTLAQAQQIIAQYMLKESQKNMEISDLVKRNATYIKKLAGQSVEFKSELTSLKNLMLLLNEINNGLYNAYKPITAMCIILSQLDIDVLCDHRALNNILLSLNKQNVLNGKNIEVIDFLIDSADMTEKEIPLVYTELSSISNNYYSKLILLLIEELYFANDNETNKDDVVLKMAIAHNIEKKYDSTTLNQIFVSLLNDIIEAKILSDDFAITNPSARQEREEAEKLFFAGKLIEAFPKFINAADSGDARACYFASQYYHNAYGTTKKDDVLYKKYIDLGIKRKDPFCHLEYSFYLYSQGDKEKYEYWRNKTIRQVGNLAEKGDAVACELIAITSFGVFLDAYSPLHGQEGELNDKEKESIRISGGTYKTFSDKAVDAGYWPAALSKCFSYGIIIDGGNREKNIEKYGWMFENVEWADIYILLGLNYLFLDTAGNKYYKNAASCFVKAYKLQKENNICGYIAFFLKAGVINESAADRIEKKDINILYYKGLDSNEPALLVGLGDLYFLGVSEEHLGIDKESAFEHYERAYDKYNNIGYFPGKNVFGTGQAEVAYKLGYMLLYGIGTKMQEEKAINYFEFAVQSGEKKAIKPLAECYLNGIGVKSDPNRYNELMAMLTDE